jgi:hypothetical protein
MNRPRIYFLGPQSQDKAMAIFTLSGSSPRPWTMRAATAKEPAQIAHLSVMRKGMDPATALIGLPALRFGQSAVSPDGSHATLGAILLLDHARPWSMIELQDYASAYAAFARVHALVVCVSNVNTPFAAELCAYRDELQGLGLQALVLPLRMGNRDDLLVAIDALIASAEMREVFETSVARQHAQEA